MPKAEERGAAASIKRALEQLILHNSCKRDNALCVMPKIDPQKGCVMLHNEDILIAEKKGCVLVMELYGTQASVRAYSKGRQFHPS